MHFGINIDDIDKLSDENPKAKSATLAAITALRKRPIARVVIDDGRPYTDYFHPIESLTSVADVMIQVCDSYSERNLGVDQYADKFRFLHELFSDNPHVVAWEIGNEINGEWLSKDAWKKVRKCADYAERHGLATAITFFQDESLPHFLAKNEPIECEWVMLSSYPTNFRDLGTKIAELKKGLLAEWLLKFTNAREFFIGEYGEDEWRGDESGRACRDLLVQAYERFKNGGFYWNFQKHCVPSVKALHDTLAKRWDERRG